MGTGTLSNDLKRWWYRARGFEDPFLKVGETNERNKKGQSEYVWALRNINLEVQQGEVLGIIGKNGAGKSTLLKILSKVTGPTTGSIHYNGRIGSLLEVGTGFHPELTGRENIFLNGAILGMTKSEIRSKLDEIVDFSGVERYIDTPVKRYSSGMMVRLGFAVAAHLEPEILVVDEVLAVGDAEFQKKAVGKMQDVSSNEGRTVLFVSHNMAAVKNLCGKAVIIENGSIVLDGNSEQVINHYLNRSNTLIGSKIGWDKKNAPGDKSMIFTEIAVYNKNGISQSTFRPDQDIDVFIRINVLNPVVGMRINLTLTTNSGEIAFSTSSHYLTQTKMQKGAYLLKCFIPKNLLNVTQYTLVINAGIPGQRFITKPFEALKINIDGISQKGSIYAEKWPGVVSPKIDWELTREL